jgi:hypothetical protein
VRKLSPKPSISLTSHVAVSESHLMRYSPRPWSTIILLSTILVLFALQMTFLAKILIT